MYREMRRRDRAMTNEKAQELLQKGEYGILSTIGSDRQPYAVPLSYIVKENKIFFHCAYTGQKLDNITYESRVCFCVVGNTEPVYENNFTTYFESVIVYGTASEVVNDSEKREVLMMLANKYLPEHMDKAPMDIANSLNITAVYQITIDHITGKEKCNGKKHQKAEEIL